MMALLGVAAFVIAIALLAWLTIELFRLHPFE
jgi:hypothetical protein